MKFMANDGTIFDDITLCQDYEKKLEIKKNNGDVDGMRRRESLEAECAKLRADTDYIAMMKDVEIPTEESEEKENE